MASSNSILQKVQQSARNYVRAAAFAWIESDSIQSGISRGTAGDDLDADQESTALPSIICNCTSAEVASVPNSGNWSAELTVHLRENADDTTEDDHLAHAGALNDLFNDRAAAETGMNELADFTVLDLQVRSVNYELIGRSWRSSITIQVHCVGQTIT
jgi:hypothetical protein